MQKKPCGRCNRTFSTWTELKNHIEKAHPPLRRTSNRVVAAKTKLEEIKGIKTRKGKVMWNKSAKLPQPPRRARGLTVEEALERYGGPRKKKKKRRSKSRKTSTRVRPTNKKSRKASTRARPPSTNKHGFPSSMVGSELFEPMNQKQKDEMKRILSANKKMRAVPKHERQRGLRRNRPKKRPEMEGGTNVDGYDIHHESGLARKKKREHGVKEHYRTLESGKRVRVRPHKRGGR